MQAVYGIRGARIAASVDHSLHRFEQTKALVAAQDSQ
jgi:hypothetical protein